MIGAWHCAQMEIVTRGVHVQVLLTEALIVGKDACAMFRDYDVDGVGALSILDLDAFSAPRFVNVFDPRRYSSRSPFTTARSRTAAPNR